MTPQEKDKDKISKAFELAASNKSIGGDYQKIGEPRFRELLVKDPVFKENFFLDLKDVELLDPETSLESFDGLLGLKPQGVLANERASGTIYKETIGGAVSAPRSLGGVQMEDVSDGVEEEEFIAEPPKKKVGGSFGLPDAQSGGGIPLVPTEDMRPKEFTPNFNQFKNEKALQQSAQSPAFKDYSIAQGVLEDREKLYSDSPLIENQNEYGRWDVQQFSADGNEVIKTLGTYDTREQAQKAIRATQRQAAPSGLIFPFKDDEEGFKKRPQAVQDEALRKAGVDLPKKIERGIVGGLGFGGTGASDVGRGIVDRVKLLAQKGFNTAKGIFYGSGMMQPVVERAVTEGAKALYGAIADIDPEVLKNVPVYGDAKNKLILQELTGKVNAANAQFQKQLEESKLPSSIVKAIKEGRIQDIPDAVLYNVADIGLQIVAAMVTRGGSIVPQILSQSYSSGVNEIAKATNRTPDQVIQAGDDEPAVAIASTALQVALENVGLGMISKTIKGAGASKVVREYIGNKFGKTAGEVAGVLTGSTGETLTEIGQEGVAIIQEAINGSTPEVSAMDILRQKRDSGEIGDRVLEIAGNVFAGTSGTTAIGRGLYNSYENKVKDGAKAVSQEEVTGDGSTRRVVVDSIEQVPAEYRDSAVEVTTGPPILGRMGIGTKKQYAYNAPVQTIEVGEQTPEQQQKPQKRTVMTIDDILKLSNANKSDRLSAINDRLLKINAARKQGEILEDEQPGEWKRLNEQKKELEQALKNRPDPTTASQEEVEAALEADIAGDVDPESLRGIAPDAYVDELARNVQGLREVFGEEQEVASPLKDVESFETAQGSVYTVLPDGRTQRFKTATQEQNEPQDLIVFAKFENPQQEQDFLSAQNREDGQKLYVVDSEGNVYNKNEEIKGKDVRLAIIKDGKVVQTVETSLTPKIGYNTFDQRRYEENGEKFRSTHLGNKVVKVNAQPNLQTSAEPTTLPADESQPAPQTVVSPNIVADGGTAVAETDIVAGGNENVPTGQVDTSDVVVDDSVSGTGDVVVAEEGDATTPITKEQTDAKARIDEFVNGLETVNPQLHKVALQDPIAALDDLIDFHKGNLKGTNPTTKAYAEKAIAKFEALKKDFQLANSPSQLGQEVGQGVQVEPTPAPAKPKAEPAKTTALSDVESTANEFTVEEDNKIKDTAIEANTKVGNYVKSVPTGRKDRFANNINEFEATNPFTNEKVIFKKQSDASQYVINEIAKANTKSGREQIFKSIEAGLSTKPAQEKTAPAKAKAAKTQIEGEGTVKEALKQTIADNAAKLKLQLGDLFKPDNTLGAVKMSEQSAKELYEKHKAIVETLKNLVSDISQIAKISADEFADLVGQKASNLFRSAYNAFKSGKTSYEDFLKANEIEVEAEAETKKSRAAERAVEGDNSEDFKSRMEELGYSYEVANRKKSGELAKKLIEDYGWETVLEGIRSGQITGAPAIRAFGNIIDILGTKLNEAKTPEEFQQALDEQSKLIKEFSLRLTGSGQEIQAAYNVYLENDFKFNLASMISQYKEAGGVMDAETLQKFKDLEQQIKDLTAKLAENEKARQAAEEAQILNAYTESQDRADKRPQGIKEAAKAAANRVRKLKLARPDYINASSPAALAWDTAVEAVASSIEAGGTIAQAIEKGLKKLRESDWYKKSNKDLQEKVEADFATQLADKATPEPEFIDGKVKITKGAIAALVRQGYDTIDKVVDKVHEMLGQPDLTKRQVRDAITKYGKTINLSKDETLKKVREITRIGRLISQLEDVRRKIRPLKTGLQRDKLTEEERRLQRQLNDALKELPPTEADLSKAIKTALDGIKSRLKNQIEDLNSQIEKKERVNRSQKKTVYDAEATALKEQRDALQTALDDLVGKQEITDEQKIKNALDAVEKSIAEYQRRINEKDFSSFQKEPAPESEELVKARAERDKLKAEYDALKNGPPKTEEQKKLERLQEQLDKILQGKIQDPKDRTEDSEEVKALKEQIQKAKEQLGLVAGKRTQAQIAYEAALKSAKRRLDEIEARVENKELNEAAKKARQFGPELDALRKRQKEAQDALENLRKEAGIIEAERLAQYKKRAQEAINEYNRRIREGDYASKEKPQILKLDAEALKLRAEKIRAKEDYLKALESARRKNTPYKWFSLQPVKDVMGAMRVFLATGEFSFVGIQGKMITAGTLLRNPKQAKQFFREMFQALASPEKGRQLVSSIKALDIYPEMKSSGLLIQDEFTPESLQNELVHTSLAEKVWNILEYPFTAITFGSLPQKSQDDFIHEMYQKSNPLEALERASNTFSNALRVSEYLRGREMLLKKGITFDDNPVAYKELAESINTMTSRTNLGRWGEAGVQNLNLIMFSARNWASTIKNLPPVSLFYYGRKNTDAATKTITIPTRTLKVGDKTVKIPGRSFQVQKELSVPQKMYIQNFMSSVALTAAITASAVAIASLMRPDDDDEEKPIFEMDTRSSAAGKVRFGSQYLDPWAGYAQHIVLYSRIIADILIDLGYSLDGSYKSMNTGEIKRLGETTFVPTKGELMSNMLRNKMSPGMGIGWDYLNSSIDLQTGERELNGREIDLLENYRQTFVPMYFESVKEIAEQQPMLAREFLISLGMIGLGVNTIQASPNKAFRSFEDEYPEDAEKYKEQISEQKIPASFLSKLVDVSDSDFEVVPASKAKGYYDVYKQSLKEAKEIYADENWLQKAQALNQVEDAKKEADRKYQGAWMQTTFTVKGVQVERELKKAKADQAEQYAKDRAQNWLYSKVSEKEDPYERKAKKETEKVTIGE